MNIIKTKYVDIEVNGFHKSEIKSIHVWVYTRGIHVWLSKPRGFELDKITREEWEESSEN